jgi:NitT/TauT family transport system ATP-binding protein
VEALPYELKDVVLDVNDVSFAIDGNPILRDVTFQVRDVVRPDVTQGQVIALLGPSGVGKTTLFRILAGLNPADKGHVLIGLKQKPVEAGMVGVVFQHYRLFEHRTVMGNLMIAAELSGCKGEAKEKRAREMLEQFGLSEFARRYPVQLSGGQRQRVAIAQQFLCSQHLLLMDEPFSGLDPIAVDNVCRLVSEVANLDELNTIFIVTHNIEAGLQVADTVLLLGRDRDASGKIIPGARVQRTYDLMKMGLTWREGVDRAPEFLELAREVRGRFREL